MKRICRWPLLALLPFCLLSAPAGAETAQGSFGVHMKISSACSAQQKLGAYSPVVVTCRPGTTPYQTQVSPLDDDNTNQTTRQNEAGYQTGTITGNEPPAAIQQMMYFSQALYRIVSVTF